MVRSYWRKTVTEAYRKEYPEELMLTPSGKTRRKWQIVARVHQVGPGEFHWTVLQGRGPRDAAILSQGSSDTLETAQSEADASHRRWFPHGGR